MHTCIIVFLQVYSRPSTARVRIQTRVMHVIFARAPVCVHVLHACLTNMYTQKHADLKIRRNSYILSSEHVGVRMHNHRRTQKKQLEVFNKDRNMNNKKKARTKLTRHHREEHL